MQATKLPCGREAESRFLRVNDEKRRRASWTWLFYPVNSTKTPGTGNTTSKGLKACTSQFSFNQAHPSVNQETWSPRHPTNSCDFWIPLGVGTWRSQLGYQLWQTSLWVLSPWLGWSWGEALGTNAWCTQMSQIWRWDGGGRVDRKQNVPAEHLSGDICNAGVALDFWSFLGLEV